MGCKCEDTYGSCIQVRASRYGEPVKVKCSLVCEVNRDAYMRVTPQDAQWIDVDEIVVYNVKSNTRWNIV